MKTILAPVDFSNVSEAVMEVAASLARAVHGRVVLLHVVQPPVITSEYGAALENIQEIVAVSTKSAEQQLARLKTKLQHESLTVETVQATGAPVPLILEQAETLGACYIVMGSHGHTALYDLLVGSTANGVLKKAPCPVVIVPPARKKSAKG